MAKVVLFGNAYMARLTHFYLRHDSPHEIAAFTVDRGRIGERTLLGLPVVPFEDVETTYPPGEFMIGIPLGYLNVNKLRAARYTEAKAKGYELISYVSSRAATWPGLVIGDNCFIYENSAIGPYTTIGNDVLIAGSSIAHDVIVGDHCFLAAHAVVLGAVKLGPYCVLGANSTCRNGITLGSECIVGAGATLTKNAPDRAVYVSKPAMLLDKGSDVLSGWLNWPVARVTEGDQSDPRPPSK